MEEIQSKEQSKELIEHVPQIAAFCFLLGTVYSTVYLNTYYGIYLHLPIFQLVDVSEIILYSPSQVMGILFLTGVLIACYIMSDIRDLSSSAKRTLGILLGVFAVTYNMLDFFSSELSTFHFKLNTSLKNLPFSLILIITCNESARNFIYKKSIFPFVVLFFTITMAFINAYSKFDHLKSPANPAWIKVKFKNGKSLQTNSDMFYAGRTNKFWFFYNQLTKVTRIIKDEDVEVSEFDKEFKSIPYLRRKEPDL